MKVAEFTAYGDERCIALRESPIPIPKDDEILIEVHATSINGSDWEFLTGRPAYARINGLRKPRKTILGSDIAGVVAEVGGAVTGFKAGDRVFCDNFERFGGFAQYVSVPQKKVIHTPHHLTHEQAAAVPQSGVIAMQCLNYGGALNRGDRLLINGAAGGVGSFAVQMAIDAELTVVGIDHGDKLDYLRTLGLSEVYDYRSLNTDALSGRFDRIIDLVGGQRVSTFKSWLSPQGTYLLVGGPVRHLLATLVNNPFDRVNGRKRMSILAHEQSENDILAVCDMVERGRIQVPVSAVYALDDIQQAFAAFRTHNALGKLVIQPQ